MEYKGSEYELVRYIWDYQRRRGANHKNTVQQYGGQRSEGKVIPQMLKLQKAFDHELVISS